MNLNKSKEKKELKVAKKVKGVKNQIRKKRC